MGININTGNGEQDTYTPDVAKTFKGPLIIDYDAAVGEDVFQYKDNGTLIMELDNTASGSGAAQWKLYDTAGSLKVQLAWGSSGFAWDVFATGEGIRFTLLAGGTEFLVSGGDGLRIDSGILTLAETTTPTALANSGKNLYKNRQWSLFSRWCG